jgi:hypothetical protein
MLLCVITYINDHIISRCDIHINDHTICCRDIQIISSHNVVMCDYIYK